MKFNDIFKDTNFNNLPENKIIDIIANEIKKSRK